MRKHFIDSRPDWQKRVANCGVDPGSNIHPWEETVCYELLPSEIDKIIEQASKFYEILNIATEDFVKSGGIFDLYDDLNTARAMINSWEQSDYQPTMFTRLDFVVNDKLDLKLKEINPLSSELLMECAIAQWQWLSERLPWASQYNYLEERILQFWRDYNLIGKNLHISYPDNDYEHYLTAEYIYNLAVEAGVTGRLIPESEIKFCNEELCLKDSTEQKINALIFTANNKKYLHEFHLNTKLSKLPHFIEPTWKYIWSDPKWLCWLEKIDALKDLMQVNKDSKNLMCNIWIIAGEVSCIGISEQGTKQIFVPHWVEY